MKWSAISVAERTPPGSFKRFRTAFAQTWRGRGSIERRAASAPILRSRGHDLRLLRRRCRSASRSSSPSGEIQRWSLGGRTRAYVTWTETLFTELRLSCLLGVSRSPTTSCREVDSYSIIEVWTRTPKISERRSSTPSSSEAWDKAKPLAPSMSASPR